MSTKNTLGCFILLGGTVMVAAAPALPSKALRGGAEAQASMQADERNLAGRGPINNDETNRKRRWRSWLSGKDATGSSANGSDSTTFGYAGCFEGQVETPFDFVVSDDAMTPEICEDICCDRSAVFYGLLGGDTCSCGDDTSLLVFDNGQTEGVCGEPCAGDASESCGGITAYDLFMDEDVEISSDDDSVDDPVYVGCYEIEASDPFYELISDEAMTVDLCQTYCASEDAIYIGLVEGIMCGCGNTDGFLSSNQETGTCDVSCGGDASETCGGALAYDLYQIEGIAINPDSSEDATCADGTIGVQTGDSCCVAECGECGGVGCSTRVTGLGASDCCTTEIADAGVMCSETGVAPCLVEDSDDDDTSVYGDYVDYEYIGCYATGSYGFEHRVSETNMTHEFCFRKCALDLALYMAITEGDVCKCGSDADFLVADKDEGTCDITCPGDTSVTCGGADSYDMFELITSSDDTDGSDDADVPADSAAGSDDVVLSDDGDFEADDGTDDGDDDLATHNNYVDYEYVGCYKIVDTFGFEHRVTELDMTHEFCFMKCALNSSLYMAITEGNVCKCGSEEGFIDADKEEGSCDIECPGDSSTICGSDDSYDLFELIVASSDTESVADDDGSDVPDVEDDDTGAVDDDTDDNSTIGVNGSGDSSDDSSDDSDGDDHEVVGPYGDYVDYERVGCFMATNTFGFRHRVTELAMTHEFCFRKCALNYAMYMAITEGIVCKCGVDEDFVDADKEEGSCDVECPGDSSQTCGSYDGSYELFSLVMSS